MYLFTCRYMCTYLHVGTCVLIWSYLGFYFLFHSRSHSCSSKSPVTAGNAAPNSYLLEPEAELMMGDMSFANNFVTVTDRCYSELFDSSELVMLSPDADLYLETYDPQITYIIGGKSI